MRLARLCCCTVWLCACEGDEHQALRLELVEGDCVSAKAPAEGFAAGRVTLSVAEGGGDVNLFAAAVPGASARCGQPIDLNFWSLVLDGQARGFDWQLPAGSAIFLGKSVPLWLSARGSARLVLEPILAGQPAEPVRALWSGQKDFEIPPGARGFAVTGTCSLSQGMRIVAIQGDVKAHATLFTVNRYDGIHIEEIYRAQAPAPPSLLSFSPEVLVAPHGGIQYLCFYDNPTSQAVRFGADPTRDEHCNLFVYYVGNEVQCLEQSGGW